MTEEVAKKPAEKKSEVENAKKPKDTSRDRGFRKPREQKEFEETILDIARVTRVVKGGRRMRFRVTVIIGDKKGRVGMGMGKAGEVLVAIQKAVAAAKKQLIRVPVFEDTIPHDIKSTFKASQILLFPAPEGTGVIAGGAVRKILELAGVKNVLSKVHGSRNAINIAYGTFAALKELQNKIPPTNKKKEASTSEEVQTEEKKEEKKTVPKKKEAKAQPKEKKAPAKKKAEEKKES